MKQWSCEVFRLATAGMFLCLAFVLGLMMVAKAYSLVPGDLWPGIVFLPFVALAYGSTEAFGATSHPDELQLRVRRAWNFLLWGSPLGWLVLLGIELLKMSSWACYIALIAPGLFKKK